MSLALAVPEIWLGLVLLQFRNFCRRLVLVGFAEKNAVFGSVSVLVINALYTSSSLRSYGMTNFDIPSSNGKQTHAFNNALKNKKL